MLKTKENCWEYFKCGREPGGARCEEHGICPAATALEFDGINHGRAAGRVCWAITASKSVEERADKFCKCMKCILFSKVIVEEGRNFELGVNRDQDYSAP